MDVSANDVSFYLFAAKCSSVLLLAICTVGVVGNSLLLYTTIRSKSLRSPCNIMIGTCAFFDILHQLGHFPPALGLYLEMNIDQWTCIVIMLSSPHRKFLPEMGVAAGSFAVLSIGIDRLFSIATPTRYRNMNKFTYLCFHYFAHSVYCAYIVFILLYFARKDQIVCTISNVFGDGVSWWAYSFAIVHTISLCIYFITWKLIRAQTKSLEVDQLSRIFRTIVLVMIFDLGGWTTTQTIIASQDYFAIPAHKHVCFLLFAALFVNSGIAVKCFVYYCSSSEYRKAINLQFHNQSPKIADDHHRHQSTAK